MLIKTLLNKAERFKSFVYGATCVMLVADVEALVIDIVARRNSRPLCPECGKQRNVYDRQPQRLFEYLPIWTFKVYFRYAPRRVNFPLHGIKVEALPWGYGKERMTVIPARPGEPRDKAKVENGVLNAQRRILAALRNRTFFSLAELNQAIAAQLEQLNSRPMQGIGKSRNQLFEELDKPALKALPLQRFELREWKKAKVHIDYHVAVQGSWYSVPYTLIGREVMVCMSATTVAILHEGKRVASHARSYRKNVYVTLDDHRPHGHQKHLEWTPERMRHWGESIGARTGAMIEAIIQAADHPDHAYRKCLGLLRLAKSCGNERLELACDRSLKLQAIGYRSVKNLLDKGLESAELPEPAQACLPLLHDNVRGSDYYAGGLQ